MRNRSRWIAVCLLAIGFMASAAHADVIYSFSGSGGAVSFQLSSPSAPLGIYDSSQLTSCVGCGVATFAGSLFTFISSSGGVYTITGNFSVPGTYSTSWWSLNKGTLVVSVPEPATLRLGFLSLATILGLVAFRRNSQLQFGRS